MNRILHLDVLITQEEEQFVAHCLQLDLVATAKSYEEVRKKIIGIIKTHLEYAYENDNLDNLFVPAPPETWKEFFSREGEVEMSSRLNGKKGGLSVIENLGKIELSYRPDFPTLEMQFLPAKKSPIKCLCEKIYSSKFGRLFNHFLEMRRITEIAASQACRDRWRKELEELAECPDKTAFRDKLCSYFKQDRGLLYEDWFVGMILEADWEKDKFTLKRIANILSKPSGIPHGHAKIELLDWLSENFANLREQGKTIMKIHEIVVEKGLYEGEYISFYTLLANNGFLSK